MGECDIGSFVSLDELESRAEYGLGTAVALEQRRDDDASECCLADAEGFP